MGRIVNYPHITDDNDHNYDINFITNDNGAKVLKIVVNMNNHSLEFLFLFFIQHCFVVSILDCPDERPDLVQRLH